MQQRIFLLALLGFLYLPHGTYAKNNEQRLQALIISFSTSLEEKLSKMQGGAFAIVHHGQVVYKKTFGHQHGHERPITENTLFALASSSKPILATVIAKLTKEKKIYLTDKVSSCFPCFSAHVQLKHLLSHTSGHLISSNGEIEKGTKRSTLLKQFFSQSVKQKPQQRYYYNNLVYSLSQEMIEKATGTSLTQQVAHLWQALGVQDFAQCTIPEDRDVAWPHAVKAGVTTAIARVPRNYPQSVCASAGSFASLNAMIEFLRLNLGYYPDVLTSQDLSIFHTPQTAAPDSLTWPLYWPFSKKKVRTSYGLGWRIWELADGSAPHEKLVFHSGYLRGVGSFVGFLPDHDVGIVVLINQDNDFATQAAIDFWGATLRVFNHL